MKIRHLHCWNVVKIEEKVVIEFDFKGHNIIGFRNVQGDIGAGPS